MTDRELRQLMAEHLWREYKVTLMRAESAGWRAVDGALASCMGFYPAQPGIVIPYLHPLTREPHLSVMRIRYFDPPPTVNGKTRRYNQPAGSGVEAYFDPNVDWASVLTDRRVEIVITEGEAKALHMNQHSKRLGGRVGVALGGVWSFLEPRRGDNHPRDLTPWLRALREMGRGRKYIIAFDSDINDNTKIQDAAETLQGLLSL